MLYSTPAAPAAAATPATALGHGPLLHLLAAAKMVVDATRECFTHAKKVGVKIAVEPLNRFETYLFNRGEQALASRGNWRPAREDSY